MTFPIERMNEDDLAELGLSVLPAHRRLGVGGALFKRAVAHARNRCIPRLLLHCLTESTPIMRMARRFGMDMLRAPVRPMRTSSCGPPPWRRSPEKTDNLARYHRGLRALSNVRFS
jgi:RimJ/RimL family protein N-acetyltransferase